MFERSHLVRRVLGAIGLSMVVAVAMAAAAGSAAASDFGELYLWQGQCCNNAPLDGSRASISTPAVSFDIPRYLCGIMRVDEEGGTTSQTQDNRLIQTGFLQCGSGTSIDGTCSTSSNMVYFTEVLWSDGYHCTPLGSAALNKTHHYSVYSYTNDDVFLTAFDGSQDPTSGYYYVTMPDVWIAVASGEIAGCSTGSNCNSNGTIDVHGYYDTNPPGPEAALRWQRYNPSAGWVTIAAATPCNGEGVTVNCSDGGWDPIPAPSGPFTLSYVN
jgi:hypothetical protein